MITQEEQQEEARARKVLDKARKAYNEARARKVLDKASDAYYKAQAAFKKAWEACFKMIE